eukprot:COSAG01_NODE_34615_length_544_cov_5.489888_2_plen_22_part_01
MIIMTLRRYSWTMCSLTIVLTS